MNVKREGDESPHRKSPTTRTNVAFQSALIFSTRSFMLSAT
jgi:hypothetical protein